MADYDQNMHGVLPNMFRKSILLFSFSFTQNLQNHLVLSKYYMVYALIPKQTVNMLCVRLSYWTWVIGNRKTRKI